MYLIGVCKKCGKRGFIDIGDSTIDEAKNKFKKVDFGECPFGGFHVESGKLGDYILLSTKKFNSIEEGKEYENTTNIDGTINYKIGTYIEILFNNQTKKDGFFIEWRNINNKTKIAVYDKKTRDILLFNKNDIKGITA